MSAHHPDEEDAPLDPAAERLRRKLTRLLMVSGGIMALGFIAVFGAIVYRLGGAGGAAAPGEIAPVAASLTLPAGVRVVSADLDGTRALLTLQAADGSASLLLLDLGSGQIFGRYALQAE